MSRTLSHHAFVPALAAASLCLLLTACGGGESSAEGGQAGTATAPVATCHTAAYQAGAVVEPTLADLAPYAGTYQGQEGYYDANFAFVKTGTATLVIAADGAITYGGKAYPVSSICQDKASGNYGRLMYFIVGNGHLDVSDKANANLGQAWGVSPADGNTIFTLGQQ
jgi:hypothetical protein